MSANNSASASTSAPVAPVAKTVEFKLKSTASNFVHNVLTLAGTPVDMSKFTTPVRLVRDPNYTGDSGSNDGLNNNNNGSDEEEGGGNSGAGGGGRNSFGRKKRRTRFIQKEDEEEVAMRTQERVPWLLEDFDGQHSYLSQLMTPESKYVIFVNQGNEFRVLPASKWYKFTPKLSYRPLTLEEAEERMASKGRNEDFDRWLMRKRNTNNSGNASQASSSSSSNLTAVTDTSNVPQKVSTRMVNLEEEGFDFNECVDDDDGEMYAGNGRDEDDPSAPRIEKSRNSKNLTEAGKQVQKIMKTYDKSNYFFNDSDDDGADPYAEGYNEIRGASEEEAEQIKLKITPATSNISPALKLKVSSMDQLPKQKLQPQKSLEDLTRKQPSSLSSSRSRSKSPTPSTGSLPRSQSPSPSAQPIKQLPPQSMFLTEEEIIAVLKEAPIKTKDLISRVKAKLKADPQNKEIFRDIVRKVATVKAAVSQEDDKLLELKPEFR